MTDPGQAVTAWQRAVDTAWRSLGAGGPPPGNAKDPGQATVDAAKAMIGKPYAWGGGTKDGASKPPPGSSSTDASGDARRFGDDNKVGFDCSGLTEYAVYQGTGKDIGHGTGNQVRYFAQHGGLLPSTEQLQPGDLVYFHNPNGGNAHTAVYEGNGMVIEAPKSGPVGDPGSEVKQTPLSQLTRTEGPPTYRARPSLSN